MKLQFEWLSGHQSVEVQRQGEQARIHLDGHQYILTLLEQNGPLLTFSYEDEQGKRKLLRIARHARAASRQAWVNGQHYHYKRVITGRSGNSNEVSDASLAPTIPSIVTQIMVVPEQTVQAGEKLILLESMKMVIPIQAPYDGIVAAINCAVGDAVEPGIPLLQLTPKEGEA
jgi:biotin carboxyl carrier protein